jgi:hypothetical protein
MCTGKNVDATNFIIIISKKGAVIDKEPKQPMTHTGTHTQSKQIINHHTSDDK